MRYFFNLAGAVYDPDNEGIELATVGEARVMAAQHAGELLRDRPGVVWQGEELRVEVTDSDRLVLFTLIVLGVDAPAGVQKGRV
jgi:phage terminase large subunit-like protein